MEQNLIKSVGIHLLVFSEYLKGKAVIEVPRVENSYCPYVGDNKINSSLKQDILLIKN